MNLERIVTDWLLAEAPARAPEQLLSVTLARVAVLPQERPLWRRGSWTRRRGDSRRLLALAATLVALSLLGGLAIFGSQNQPTRTTPVQTTNGWVAFAADGNGTVGADLYLVREGQAAHRIVGSDSDEFDEMCPAFSPDGTRLAYGRAEGTGGSGYANAGLVIVDLDGQGGALTSMEIALGDTFAPPCAIWAPDGRRLAFPAARPTPDALGWSLTSAEVRVVRLDDGQVISIPVTNVTDMEWSSDGSQLAIARGDRVIWQSMSSGDMTAGSEIGLYSLPTGEMRSLPGTLRANSITWSPDGTRIAYERGIGDPAETVWDRKALVVRDVKTGAEEVLDSGYDAMHGIGPVWSPTSDRIVYQRVCEHQDPDGLQRCFEQHDVVVVTAGPGSSWSPSDRTEAVLPRVDIPSDGGDGLWWPDVVTWSPDDKSLLYVARGPGSDDPVALIVVPVSSTAEPVKLVVRPDISFLEGDYGFALQNWGREPAAAP